VTTVEQPRPTEQALERQPEASGAERAARREVDHEFRPRRSIPASIVAAALAAASALVAIEIIVRLVDESNGVLPVDRLAELGRETRWEDGLLLAIAGLAIIVGLLLLWLALWPGRPRASGLVAGQPGVVMALSRPALRRIAAQAAETVDGVSRARARDRRGSITMRIDTPLHDPGDLADQVRRRVAERLDRYQPLREQRIRVGIRRRVD
jgi:hypothetical protein